MLEWLTEFLSAEGELNAFFEQVSNALWGWNFHSLLFALVACGIFLLFALALCSSACFLK